MNISHIEHLGIAVKSLEEAIPYYENILGLKCYSIEEVADQKVKTAFFKVGQTKIELLEPTSEDSTIAKFIEKRGEGIHHMAFAIEDGVANALADIKTVYNNEKACQKLRGHGRQHIMKKLCLRALYVRLHGGCSFLFRCGPGQARLKLPLCSARAVQAFVINAQRGQAV